DGEDGSRAAAEDAGDDLTAAAGEQDGKVHGRLIRFDTACARNRDWRGVWRARGGSSTGAPGERWGRPSGIPRKRNPIFLPRSENPCPVPRRFFDQSGRGKMPRRGRDAIRVSLPSPL